jgi:F0F1-type ATP synthase assembly protein I
MSRAPDDHRVRGRRLTVRYAGMQLLPVVVAAGVFAFRGGWLPALAVLTGGVVVALGTLCFGWVLFGPGIAPVRVLSRAATRAELLKWVWTGGALWFALSVAHFKPLPLVVGVLVAQIGFWLAMAFVGR